MGPTVGDFLETRVHERSSRYCFGGSKEWGGSDWGGAETKMLVILGVAVDDTHDGVFSRFLVESRAGIKRDDSDTLSANDMNFTDGAHIYIYIHIHIIYTYALPKANRPLNARENRPKRLAPHNVGKPDFFSDIKRELLGFGFFNTEDPVPRSHNLWLVNQPP